MKQLVIAVAILASGCQPAKPSTGPTVGAGFDERQTCRADVDCAVVEIACCDHCNGGIAVGIHRDSADAVREEYAGPDRCQGTACTLMACAPAVPICRQERCGISIDGTETMAPLPRP
jgi:hypothetical protein